MERNREADGSIIVRNHSGLEYEILAELAGALLERAGHQQNTLVDFAKDPARVGSEMEIAKAQSTLKGALSTLKGALKRDPLPQVAQPPQDVNGNGRGRGRKREGCFNCGEFGHRAANCPQSDKRQRRDGAPRPPKLRQQRRVLEVRRMDGIGNGLHGFSLIELTVWGSV